MNCDSISCHGSAPERGDNAIFKAGPILNELRALHPNLRDDVNGGRIRLVTAGVITTPAHTPLPDRLEEIYSGLTDIIKETQPDVMSVEKLFFTKNITTAISVAEARGVAILTGRQAKLPIHEYTPNEIKKSITGYGAAKKPQIQEMVRIQLGLQEVPKPDDCADALAAALTHAFMSRIEA